MQQNSIDTDICPVTNFILKAMQCDFNNLWVCTHCENKGNRCTEVCPNYTVKGFYK